MNIISVVISSIALLYISNAENSRLLLQDNCVCTDEENPVCCNGNTDYSTQCMANCASATNCIQGICEDLANTNCQTLTVPCPSTTECQLKEDGIAGEVECVMIPDYCQLDSDCEVKNVGNCCGYYPGCVNSAYEPDLAAVKEFCEANNLVSICGWIQPSGCTCQNERCVEEYTKLTPTPTVTNNCDIFPDGYTLVGTPETCPVIFYICELGYIPWSNECGCGCKLDCSSLPADYRIFASPERCDTAKFGCNIGEEFFRNDCGCGCKQISNPCAAMLCLTGTKCVDNGDGTGTCVGLEKQRCNVRRRRNKCDNGYDCIPDPQCDGNVISRRNRKRGVCIKRGGSCGGVIGKLCEYKEEQCAYPCGSTLGECVTYQYR